MQSYHNITGYLAACAASVPHKAAYIFLEDGEDKVALMTYEKLEQEVGSLAFYLHQAGWSEQRVLLIYADGLDFIIAFLACMRAGVIAVPLFLPRNSKHMDRLHLVIQDVQAAAILCHSRQKEKISRELQPLIQEGGPSVVAADDCERTGTLLTALTTASSVAFIQYTSGSTGQPKGVLVTHENLLHNQQLIKGAFGCDEQSIIGSWLPFYHDMGLIGTILHTLYTGATAVLMTPFHFIQHPLRWLQMISRYRVTHSGGPNFAFDLCVERIPPAAMDELDLSCWKVAYNGAEGVRAQTLDAFTAHCAAAGFRRLAFYPCYGLAEATLLVSGGREPATAPLVVTVQSSSLEAGKIVFTDEQAAGSRRIVASGCIAAGMQVKVVTEDERSGATGTVTGEICIAGKSVTRGYWQREHASLYFPEAPSQPYFRTGDIGFIHQQQLFITGRIKELLIIRGRNYYPYDIELEAVNAHAAIAGNGAAAFAVSIDGKEELVLVAEIKRTYRHELAAREIMEIIQQQLLAVTGLTAYDIVLVNEMSVPRTSSGKIQRLRCAGDYTSGQLPSLATWRALPVTAPLVDPEEYNLRTHLVKQQQDVQHIQDYLELVFMTRLPNQRIDISNQQLELTAIGLDSLKIMEVINTINRDLQIQLDITKVYQLNNLSGLTGMIATLLWLNNNEPAGKEIII